MDLIEAILANDGLEVEKLLRAGADPNQKRGRRSALDHVPHSANIIRCALIEAGAYQSSLAKEMAWAVSTGRLATVQALIKRKADLNKRAPMGSPLEIAARYGYSEITRCLLEAGANPNQNSPLGRAIEFGHSETALLLLKHGANPTGLAAAAYQGLAEVVASLLSQGMDPNQIHRALNPSPLREFTALHAAALAGQIECLRVLLEAGADPGRRDLEGRTMLEVATPEVQTWLELQSIEVQPDPGQELRSAAEQGNMPELHRWIQSGLDLQSRGPGGRTALMLAAAQGHLAAVDALLKAGVEPNSLDSDTVRPNLQRLVYKTGKSLLGDEALGQSALFYAARAGHGTVVTRLIEAGADPNLSDFLGETPSIWAAESGHLEALEALLKGGAKPDGTALRAATEARQVDCAMALLHAGAAPKQSTFEQTAGLAEAALLRKMLELKPKLKPGPALGMVCMAMRTVPADQAPGNWPLSIRGDGIFKSVPEPEEKILQALEVLLAAGAPVDAVSRVGTALYAASMQGLIRVVHRLLEAGADPTLTYEDSTPQKIATLLGHTETAKILRQASSKHS